MTIDQKWIESKFPELSQISALNHGGQKWVFSAIHVRDGDVVLKIVKPHSDPERIRREVIAAQKVSHPRVPTILEVGTCSSDLGNCVWIREQRVPGECLRPVVSRGPRPMLEVLRLGLQLLDILVATERENLVHRDVKPDNIIRDTSGAFWLIDFGLARHLDLESATGDGPLDGVGTVGYSAPEQMRNRKNEIDGRADLFAVAVTLYEAATGINPFRQNARTPLECLNRSESDDLPRLNFLLPGGSGHNFSDLVATMAQKRRDLRPRTVEDAHVWMQEICAMEGVA